MASTLYRRAVGVLPDDEGEALSSFESWLASCREDRCDGSKLVANIRSESHLVGDGEFGHPEELAAFLKLCAAAYIRVKSRPARWRRYLAACGAHGLKGLTIPGGRLPGTLLRYSTSRRVAAVVVERVLGKAARAAFDNGTLPARDAFSRVAAFWAASRMTAENKLAVRRSVFATFEHEAGAPRDDAAAMAQALALPVAVRPMDTDAILFEFSYAADAVRGHRFPTVADARGHHLFQPAPEVEPDWSVPPTCWGWTDPLGGQPPQPEIVHENESLRILSAAPRFVGRITR